MNLWGHRPFVRFSGANGYWVSGCYNAGTVYHTMFCKTFNYSP
jgi:hypothetical protein